MKLAALAFLSVVPAAMAQPVEVRIEGAAAAEMYDKLNIPETEVRDEHGGQPHGTAKYGKNLGCSKEYDKPASCWVIRN